MSLRTRQSGLCPKSKPYNRERINFTTGNRRNTNSKLTYLRSVLTNRTIPRGKITDDDDVCDKMDFWAENIFDEAPGMIAMDSFNNASSHANV